MSPNPLRRRRARRQIPAAGRPGVPVGQPGAGAPGDPAAPARRGRGPEHRRLRLGLSRLAARPLRHGDVGGGARCSTRITSTSAPRSTRTSRRRRSGAASTSARSPARNTTACSASGTARDPGVDRSGDVFRHANSAGTSALGGVLAIAGDDHGAKSSTITNFSDQIFTAVGMPLLYPSNAQEVLEFGLHGIAMSRYSGCWVGMKVVTDIIEGGGTIEVGLDRPRDHAARRASAAGRARRAGLEHPPARPGDRAGRPAVQPQAARGDGVHPRQRPQPHHARCRGAARRRDRRRQGLPGRAAGAGRAGPHRRALQRARAARGQGRRGLAARSANSCAPSPRAST